MFAPDHIFADRRDAGRKLAQALQHLANADPVVLALPRGGVPVAFEVAQALHADLDVVLVRKIGAPGHPELGLGAIVDGPNPQVVLNEEIVRALAPPQSYLAAEQKRQLDTIEDRRRLYRGDRKAVDVSGRAVILVDDGIATGGSVKAALRALSRNRPARLVLAVPVAPQETLEELRVLADEIVCLAAPEPFHAVGLHYADFSQTSDAEVVRLLGEARQWQGETVSQEMTGSAAGEGGQDKR